MNRFIISLICNIGKASRDTDFPLESNSPMKSILFITLVIFSSALLVEHSIDTGKSWNPLGDIDIPSESFTSSSNIDFSKSSNIHSFRIGNTKFSTKHSAGSPLFQLHLDENDKFIGFSVSFGKLAKNVIVMKPLLVGDIVEPSQQKVKEEAKKDEPEPSFLRKYWFYILPVALLLLFGGAGAPLDQKDE